MKANLSTTESTSIAASVGPEDLACGDFAAVLNEVVEFPSFLWCDAAHTERGEPVRVCFVPENSGTPLKIKAICLPFVFVKSPGGRCRTIDVRQRELVRVDRRYAEAVWNEARKEGTRRE